MLRIQPVKKSTCQLVLDFLLVIDPVFDVRVLDRVGVNLDDPLFQFFQFLVVLRDP